MPPPAASSQKLADGVFLILPAYAALAVDFKDYIVIVEGPQSTERGEGIIAEAKRIPTSPSATWSIRTTTLTIRAACARSLPSATIITHAQNKGYYEKIFNQPQTSLPTSSRN
jgi:hypothetical protein